MKSRREFLAGALVAGLPVRSLIAATPAEDAAAAIERLRTLYSSLTSYVDVTRTTTTSLGMDVPGEIRTAYTAPGRLCMQTGLRGEVYFCDVIDGDNYSNWHHKKGWRSNWNLDLILAGLHGSGVMLGLFPWWLVLLLFDKQRSIPEGLRQLEDPACTFNDKACEGLQGSLEDTSVRLDLNPVNGAIQRIQTEESRDPVGKIAVKAEVKAHFNAQFDMGRVMDAVRRAPDTPMTIKDLR